MKILVVGGVAGGATFAARMRRLGEDHEIIMFEKGEYISFANCGLPYYIGDVIKKKEALLVQSKEGLEQRYNLKIRIKSEVTKIIPQEKQIQWKDLTTGEIHYESYDKLVLSCGADAISLDIKGKEENSTHFLKTMEDTFKLREVSDDENIKDYVVVGGGAIGIEVAENLIERGKNVTIVEKSPQVLPQLDFEMAQLVHRELNYNKVSVILQDEIVEIKNQEAILASGRKIKCQQLILSVGIKPNNGLAKDNFKVGERGYLKVNKNYNVYNIDNSVNSDIYAIGDMIEVVNPLDKTSYNVALAWGANRQGRLVADVISGKEIKESGIYGANAVKVFSLTVATVGANKRQLEGKNIAYKEIVSHKANHATYYVDPATISLKILFDKETGKIYGAQGVGGEGTDKRIDVIGTVMQLNGSVASLSGLELCYAPPYSHAKDPTNIIGYIGENVMENVYDIIEWKNIDKEVENGTLLLDVRTEYENSHGKIKGSVLLPLDNIRDNLHLLPQDKNAKICVHCAVGQRAYLAIRILKNLGYTNLYNLTGGYFTYIFGKYNVL